VTVHLKDQTECFECQPKPVPKSFPICTLRNTPDKPIHCIVWSKDLLFQRLFGRPDAVTGERRWWASSMQHLQVRNAGVVTSTTGAEDGSSRHARL
jgi:hypothetical protein